MKVLASVTKFLAPLVLMSSSAFATGIFPAEPVSIQSISAKGTGCADASTVSTNISEDKLSFTVAFSEFFAEVGPSIPLSYSRRNCALTLRLKVPQGWQFTVGTFNYRGFIDLDAGLNATHTTTYFFAGNPIQARFSAPVYGEFSGDYVYSDTVGLASAVWSPCGVERDLTLNTAVNISKTSSAASDAEGVIFNDTVDGQLKQLWGIAWRRC